MSTATESKTQGYLAEVDRYSAHNYHPLPVVLERGEGVWVWDVDGNEYVDLHGGYGAMLAGHAHPAVVAAVSDRVRKGTHFAQPTADAIAVAEELSERYGLPLWRFGNSGTEATMDAVHLMRAITGRDLIIKFEGGYHGHHDSVMVSVWNEDGLGSESSPKSVAAGSGIPQAIVDLTLIASFNHLETVSRLLEQHEGKVAGIIVEPVLQNCGVLLPDSGFLEGLRDLSHRHEVLLTFDEVKTGLTVGKGGATRRYGVKPDIVCLAKSLGGGLPISAIGGTEEVMGHIVDGSYEQVGTFNGNPLSLAAARAMLEAVNLASPVADGQQILVPAKGRGSPAGGPGPGGSAPGTPLGGRVHLNTATLEQLDALPGIGPVTAQKILDYRTEKGAFQSVDELDAVPGIGPARLEQLRELVDL